MSEDPAPAPWWKRAVFYQIYPSSFADSNGDGFGDLPGIIDRIGHVASLGVDAIWLSPFFTSPMKDFGYDVADYRAVDPRFGTLADFDRLVARAHALGLKIVIDQVWSHTSDRHAWFRASAARDPAYADWYVWADARPDGSPPNNWRASFGGPAWSWHPGRRQYYLHNFLPEQPDLNFHCPAVQDAILDVARFWLDRGVDGFRLDVINHVAHDRLLRDNPVHAQAGPPAATIGCQRQRHNKSQPEGLAFAERVRALLDSYRDRMAVGEIFDDDMLGRQRDYTDGPTRLHTAYSFHLLNAAAASPALFREAIEAWVGAPGWPSWSLGNHDVPRFPTRLAGDDPRVTRTLITLLMCLPGTPFLYQGEELGLPQARVPYEALRDPFAIASWTEEAQEAGRDGARTPMPWAATTPDGWLPLDPRHRALSVEAQEEDRESMLRFTRRLLALRKSLPALQTGATALRDAPDGVLAFERNLGGETLLCLFELSGQDCGLAPEGETLFGALPLRAFGHAIVRL